MLLVLISILLFVLPVKAAEYNLYSPEKYDMQIEQSEKILFIVDFSNSMTEYLDGKRKIDVMLETMENLLTNINPKTQLGLRVYGHKGGLTAFDACRASALMVPIGNSDPYNLSSELYRLNSRGMTPITYSLKQAVKNDFLGINGPKRIILLTDGGENCDESPCDYVMELIKVRKDIHIDVIAFNIQDEEDLAQLQCTALVTSGKFYTANTAAELAKSLNNSVGVRKDVDARIIRNY